MELFNTCPRCDTQTPTLISRCPSSFRIATPTSTVGIEYAFDTDRYMVLVYWKGFTLVAKLGSALTNNQYKRIPKKLSHKTQNEDIGKLLALL